MNSQPMVSICIPVYNGENYLEEALDSIENQNYKNFEIIISDDNSNDNSLKIIEEYKLRSKFNVRLFHHNPSGIGANWNNCIKNSNGKYIKFLFQDDILHEDCILKMVDFLEKEISIGLVACQREFIIEGEKTEKINDWLNKYGDLQVNLNLKRKGNWVLIDEKLFISEELIKSPFNKIGEPSAVLFKSSLIDKLGYFDENLSQILDYEYFYRILKIKKIGVLNEKLIKFRLHSEQATNKNIDRGINEEEAFYKILVSKFYGFLSLNNRQKLFRYRFPFIYKLSYKFRRAINFFR